MLTMTPPIAATTIRAHNSRDLAGRMAALEAYVLQAGRLPLSCHPGWLRVLERGLGQRAYCLEAVDGDVTRGILPLAYVSSLLFGKFLVGLPYLNYGGVRADDPATAMLLIDRAANLADKLGVRYLELRSEQPVEHPKLTARMSSKVHMRLALPEQSDILWKALPAKVRNQVRKGQKSNLTVSWGGADKLDDFYAVFSRNMRDLGTPTYGKRLFASILEEYPERAEFCIVRAGEQPAAAALLLHGWGATEVPSASCLREFNSTCANMLMYWHLLERAIERKQETFDFGRSTRESNTHRFKEQWGAKEAPAEWQYYIRTGSVGEMRPDNPRYQRMIRTWQKLPVWLTRLIGPRIVRGIP
jgi:serine/alanine adding enzyme